MLQQLIIIVDYLVSGCDVTLKQVGCEVEEGITVIQSVALPAVAGHVHFRILANGSLDDIASSVFVVNTQHSVALPFVTKTIRYHDLEMQVVCKIS